MLRCTFEVTRNEEKYCSRTYAISSLSNQLYFEPPPFSIPSLCKPLFFQTPPLSIQSLFNPIIFNPIALHTQTYLVGDSIFEICSAPIMFLAVEFLFPPDNCMGKRHRKESKLPRQLSHARSTTIQNQKFNIYQLKFGQNEFQKN